MKSYYAMMKFQNGIKIIIAENGNELFMLWSNDAMMILFYRIWVSWEVDAEERNLRKFLEAFSI